MASAHSKSASRRTFLKFLAGSPSLMYPGLAAPQALPAQQKIAVVSELLSRDEYVIAGPEEAINVFEFETVARQTLLPAHWGYLATGVDDDATLRANRDAFSKLLLRPRHLVDVTQIDMTTELFDMTWKAPIVLAPVGSLKAYHAGGELAAAKAARDYLMILSTPTTTSVEDVTAAKGGAVWFQLYPTSNWSITQALLRRAEAAGCPVVVLTVDLPVGRGRRTDTFERLKRIDTHRCADCHQPGLRGEVRRKPMFDGLDLTGLTSTAAPGLTWGFIDQLKQSTKMKVVVKGILTREDAKLCLEHGVDGIIVSNHGGRADDGAMATIDALPEVVEVARGRVPVLIDGGFRRGTDIFKALALGAQAICIGRPYVWGLAAFGQAGVERVLEIQRIELELIMKQCGTPSLRAITPSFVRRS